MFPKQPATFDAALSLAGNLLGGPDDKQVNEKTVDDLTSKLTESIDRDTQGRPQLTITLGDETALRSLAMTLATLLDQTQVTSEQSKIQRE